MKHLFLLLLMLLFANSCFGQWKNIDLNCQVSAMGAHDSNLFVVSKTEPEIRIFRYSVSKGYGTADFGIDWTQGTITSFYSVGKYLFAGQQFSNGANAGEYRTSNDGIKWDSPIIGSPICWNGSFLFGGWGDIGIARSQDTGGSNWDSITNLNIKYLAVLGSGRIFVCTQQNILWHSSDNGGGWFKISSQPPFFGKMLTMGSKLFIIDTNAGKVTLSTDSGGSWSPFVIDSAGMALHVNCIATDGKHLFAGARNGVYVSLDTGHHWYPKNEGFSAGLDVYNICVFDTMVAVDLIFPPPQWPGAVYVRPISQLLDTTKSGVQSVSQPPADTLEVYPNPATGLITIHSGSAAIEQVSVINLLGVDVLDLPNLRQSNITLDISKLSSGTYFLRIETANGRVLRKVIRE